MLTFVPIVLMTIAMVLARFYTLDSALHERIRGELQARTDHDEHLVSQA
jgi:Na+/melibiose symporter-like transporter